MDQCCLLIYGHVNYLNVDVVTISAKLVCHLCFVCKLNYLFGAHMFYGGVTTPVTVSSVNLAVACECRAPLPTGIMTRSLYTDGQRLHYIQPGTHPSCAIKVTTNKLEKVLILS